MERFILTRTEIAADRRESAATAGVRGAASRLQKEEFFEKKTELLAGTCDLACCKALTVKKFVHSVRCLFARTPLGPMSNGNPSLWGLRSQVSL